MRLALCREAVNRLPKPRTVGGVCCRYPSIRLLTISSLSAASPPLLSSRARLRKASLCSVDGEQRSLHFGKFYCQVETVGCSVQVSTFIESVEETFASPPFGNSKYLKNPCGYDIISDFQTAYVQNDTVSRSLV